MRALSHIFNHLKRLLSAPRALLHALLCLILIIPAQVYSQQSYNSIPLHHELTAVDLNADENTGLLTGMIQDNDGYLWISSSRGMVIFDGHKSILYSHDGAKLRMGSRTDSSFHYYFLRKSPKGEIHAYVIPGGKIVAIDPVKKIAQYQYEAPSSYLNFYPFEPQSNAIFYVSTNKIADSMTIVGVQRQGIPKNIFSFSKKETGELASYALVDSTHWIQTSKGILRIAYDGKKSSFYPFLNNSGITWYAASDELNFYFVEDALEAIMYWNSTMTSPRIFAPLPKPFQKGCNFFYVDHHKAYVGGGTQFGIIDTLTKNYENLNDQYFNLKADKLQGSLSEDMRGLGEIDGQIYFLGGKNLYRLRDIPPSVSVYKDSIPSSVANLSMRGLTEDDKHNVYASYYNGIAVKSADEDQFRSLDLIKDLDKSLYSAFSLTYFDHRIFWHSLSIDLLNGKIKQIIPNVPNGHVVQMRTGDTLWMYIWNSSHFYKYALSSGQLDSVSIEKNPGVSVSFPFVVNDIIQSQDSSTMWLATRLDGIVVVNKNGNIIKNYSQKELGTSIEEGICDLFLQGDNLWYGCFDGLGKLNIKSGHYTLFKDPVINSDKKQNNRIVFSILPDEKNGFYLGTSNGLVYFDTLAEEFMHLDPAHPMAQNEYNRTSAFKDSQGRYYFGTTNGLYSFLPQELDFKSSEDTLRPIRLFNVSIFNGSEKKYRYLSEGLIDLKKLELNASETNIEFSFSVAEFDKNIYYSHRVVGLNDTWSDYTTDNKILMNSLPPGKYQLEVKASTGANDVKASYYTLDIFMPEYWYRQAWVIVLAILLISGLITLAFRYRFQQKWKRQKELEKLRVNISSNLHDDVGSILSGLAMQSQMMSYHMDEKDRKPMLELSEMSREAMERMRDTVWAIDARKDKYENLIDRMRDFVEKNLERKNITHEFIVEGVEGKKFINPEVRQNIYLIFKEAITNIVKHADATHVKIIFYQSPEWLRLVIHDNGSEKNMTSSDGSGLSNMKMRAEKLHGTIRMEYEEGFKVELKAKV